MFLESFVTRGHKLAENLSKFNFTEFLNKRVLPFVGALSGLSAVFTAIGYLAERSHLALLGFTSIPVDLKQYLYTGLKFMAGLPTLLVALGMAYIESFFNSIFGVLDWKMVIVLVLGLWLAWHFLSQLRPFHILKGAPRRTIKAIRNASKSWVDGHRKSFLLILLVFQLGGLIWLTHVAKVQNILFGEDTNPNVATATLSGNNHNDAITDSVKTAAETSLFGISHTIGKIRTSIFNKLLPPSVNELRTWIHYRNANQFKLQSYFFKLFCIILVSALVTWNIHVLYNKGTTRKPDLSVRVLFGINVLLLSTAALLLPVNYGALLMSKQYPVVQVRFSGLNARQDDGANHPPQAICAIPDQSMQKSLCPQFKRFLNYSPPIFTDPDGDMLTYTALSSDRAIAKAEIKHGNLLVVSLDPNEPASNERATITVRAYDNRGGVADTSFIVRDIDESKEIFLPPEPRGSHPINDTTLVVGGPPFTHDLEAFGIFEAENELIYTTFSTNSDRAKSNILENRILVVEPVSSGTATIRVAANAGTGFTTEIEFEVRIINEKLSWPSQNERLILLYQAGNVLYLYSREERRVWSLSASRVESLVYYGLEDIFQ